MAKGFSLFGFKLGSGNEVSNEVLPSFSPPILDDGAVTITAAAHYGTSIDLESNYKNDVELITRYREMSMQPEIESAVDDIINEAIIQEDNSSIEIVLDKLKAPPKVKNAIEEEFNNILTLLNFKHLGQDIFRRFYVDGRLFYNLILDKENPQNGIQELRYTDPRKLSKVREIKKVKDKVTGYDIVAGYTEYYIYSEVISSKSNLTNSGVRIAPDTIISVTSGLLDSKRSIVLSYLHKAIKPLNQLRMIEDASVIYKVSRAPERRIFYIDVGNLPKMKAEQYLKDIMTKYKNKVVYDACLDLDTMIPLLDGRNLPLRDIIDEYESGKELWGYSCDPKTGKFEPGLISWAGITRLDEPVMRLTLDNNEEIICTLDHKFPVWNKGFVEAHQLVVGESMIPFYTREKPISSGKNTYQQIFKNDTKKWEYTHREVSSWKDFVGMDNEYTFNENYVDELKQTIHHKNYNRYDNSPENLSRMFNIDHFEYHRQHCSLAGKIGGKISDGFSPEAILEMSKRGKSLPITHFQKMSAVGNASRWNSENGSENRIKLAQSQTILYTDKLSIELENCARLNLNKSQTVERINKFNDIISDWIGLNKLQKIKHRDVTSLVFTNKDISRLINEAGFSKWKEYKDSLTFRNHKIVKIEYLEETRNVGTLTIDRDEIYHDHHTFALSCGIYTKNSTGEIRDDRKHLSMMEDFWLPRRSDNKSTEITTLPSSSAFDDMSMVEYFEKKLYKSLSVPYSRLHDPDNAYSIGRSSEVSRDEIKFNKFINRLRLKFTDLFDQALKVQCYLKGICTQEEFEQFKQDIYYDFQKDNNYAELKEAELISNRLNLLAAVDPYKGVYFSQEWIQRKVLNLDDDDIKMIEKQITQEIADGLYPDPKLMNNPSLMAPGDGSMTPHDGSLDQDSGSIDDEENTQQPSTKNKQDVSPSNPYFS